MTNDFTFDMFVEDAELYTATPIKGVYCNSNASDRKRFMAAMKNAVRDFIAEWNNGKMYRNDCGWEWIGDAFAEYLSEMNFSDMYKDAYGQRPHLHAWYYVHVLGLPMLGDTSRTFCAYPIEDAIGRAKMVREILLAE